MINHTHGNIAVADQQYQKNIHDYHPEENFGSGNRKPMVEGEKDLVMRYATKTLVELIEWLYIRYGYITPGELMNNQYTM